MSNNMKKQNTGNTAKQTAKRSNLPIVIAASVLVVAALVVIVIYESRPKEDPKQYQPIAAGEFLSIPTADIGSKAVFYPIEVDGTKMEVLAVRASDGTVRTAFNTCQSCYTSGAGYYVQVGNDLVCQNCGQHFTPDEVGIRAGGCNPWPIFAADQTVTDDLIQISYDFLKSSSSIFSNWKR